MKGATNNPNGRPKGSLNKLSRDTKEILKGFIEERLNETLEDFNKLEPKEKFDVIIKILPFLLPKVQSIQLTNEFENLSDSDIDKIISKILSQ